MELIIPMKVLFNTNFTFDVSLMEIGLAIIFKPKNLLFK